MVLRAGKGLAWPLDAGRHFFSASSMLSQWAIRLIAPRAARALGPSVRSAWPALG
jgi:hypothetical protein